MTAPAVRPDATEYPAFYAGYVASIPGTDVVGALQRSGEEISALLASIAEDRGGYRYADGKWSIRTLIGHVVDAERIFSYRALRLARGDSTPLPGFDENAFALAADSDARTVASLADEFAQVRASTVRLFASLPADAWTRSGVVNNGRVTVRALGYIAAGHAAHHASILRERYGV
jgi:hypothetical protein